MSAVTIRFELAGVPMLYFVRKALAVICETER